MTLAQIAAATSVPTLLEAQIYHDFLIWEAGVIGSTRQAKINKTKVDACKKRISELLNKN